MKSLLIRHVIIQLCLLIFYFANEAVVNLLNTLMTLVGINPVDTHLSLGVYVFAGLSFILPLCYLVITEYHDKKKIARYFNFWLFRLEVVLLTVLGITVFIS